MSKIKKLFIVLLVACMAVCLSFAVAACDDENFRDPGNTNPDNSSSELGNYVVTVNSAGGIPLSNVTVNVKKNGSTLKTLISVNGQVSFKLDPDVYELEVVENTLPAGYYIPADVSFSTKADDNNAEISIPSKVITTTATSGTSYKLGDVMYDFVATEAGGNTQYKLSELLETKKAVMINCWGITCVPCQMEFPAIQSAYEAYSDKLEIVALSSYGSDTEEQIKNFKETNKYTFPMALDKTSVYNLFGVEAWPTSIIVDRYGVVAYISSGTETSESFWKALFNKYTSDNYIQTAPSTDTDSDEPTEWTKPTGVTMSDPDLIASAINGEGTEGKVGEYYPELNEYDKDYTWPWVLKEDSDGKYITASNSGVSYSYSIIYTDIHLEAGDALSYEYNIDSEPGGDILYVLINNSLAAEYSGSSGGWQTEEGIYTAAYDTTIQFAVCYMKNNTLDVGSDTASIRNINIYDIKSSGETVDVKLSATYGANLTNGNYDVTLELDEEKNYYYIIYEEYGETRKALLLADILNPTLWSQIHLGSNTFTTPENYETDASLYMISYWQMSNYIIASAEGLEFTYGHTDDVISSYYLQKDISDYDLTPVTPQLKAAIEAFTKEYFKSDANSWYEGQWLEFCYYYRHYGAPHEDRECYETYDFASGYMPEYGLTLEEGTVHVNIQKASAYNGGGLWYKFVPDKTGVYYIHTSLGTEGSDPRVRVYSSSDGKIELDNVIAENDDDVKYDRFLNPDLFNSYLYVEMVAGQEYFIQGTTSVRGNTADYYMTIEYAGEYVEFLRVCSTGDGAYTWSLDTGKLIYLAINAAINPDDGYYYSITADREYGSIIYIDFVHPNYFDQNDHTLYEIINYGAFDFSDYGDEDYTDIMLEYYNKSIAGKNTSDPLYGMTEASIELVNLINKLMAAYGDTPETNSWLSLANYFEYYGTPSGN